MGQTAKTKGETQLSEHHAQSWANLRLPPFPQVAVRVLQLVNNENVQLNQLSDLIASDPAFATEVLTIANSLLYAPRFPANSVLQAIALLGANNLQGLCFTVAARAYLSKALNRPAMRGVWRHSLATALIAMKVAATGFDDLKEIAFTYGVMHDVGRLALAAIRPREYVQLLEAHVGSPVSILPGERELFGCDHCEAGNRLVADWKLPAEFAAIVAEHHAPRAEDAEWGMVGLIGASCKLADTAGFPAFQLCECAPYPELIAQLPTEVRDRFPQDVEDLTLEIREKIDSVESF